jgi:mevalonate kinase
MIDEEFIPVNNQCIDSLLKGEGNLFFNSLNRLSQLQYKYFQPMIPPSMQAIWENGLKNGNYHMKLCGSGGGGFMLGFARYYDKARGNLKNTNWTFSGLQKLLIIGLFYNRPK